MNGSRRHLSFDTFDNVLLVGRESRQAANRLGLFVYLFLLKF
jgi:hypothetical protein